MVEDTVIDRIVSQVENEVDDFHADGGIFEGALCGLHPVFLAKIAEFYDSPKGMLSRGFIGAFRKNFCSIDSEIQ